MKKLLKPKTIKTRLARLQRQLELETEIHQSHVKALLDEEVNLQDRCEHQWGNWHYSQYEISYRICQICGKRGH